MYELQADKKLLAEQLQQQKNSVVATDQLQQALSKVQYELEQAQANNRALHAELLVVKEQH